MSPASARSRPAFDGGAHSGRGALKPSGPVVRRTRRCGLTLDIKPAFDLATALKGGHLPWLTVDALRGQPSGEEQRGWAPRISFSDDYGSG